MSISIILISEVYSFKNITIELSRVGCEIINMLFKNKVSVFLFKMCAIDQKMPLQNLQTS